MHNRHLELHLLLMILKFQLLIFSSLFLTFVIYDLELFDDVLEASHLVSRCELDLLVFHLQIVDLLVLVAQLSLQSLDQLQMMIELLLHGGIRLSEEANLVKLLQILLVREMESLLCLVKLRFKLLYLYLFLMLQLISMMR